MKIMPIVDWKTPASKIPEQSVGGCHVIKKKIGEGKTLPMGNTFGYDQAIFAHDTTVTVLRCGKRKAMDTESVWVSDTPQEVYDMWELSARTEGPKVLVGGLGLGILANLLSLRRDINEVVVVDNNPHIISMVKPYLDKKVKVIEGDFIKQMGELSRRGEKFDTVISDIYKSKEDKKIFEDVQMAMDDEFGPARHLHWAFQKDADNEIAALIKAGAGTRRPNDGRSSERRKS